MTSGIVRKALTGAIVVALTGSGLSPALAATQISDLNGMRAGNLDGELVLLSHEIAALGGFAD